MIIARASGPDGREILILGLSKHNIGRLELGQPMRIRREVHGEGVPEGWEILIVYGETELAIRQDFEKYGLISDDTKIHVDPKLQREWGEA